MKMTIYLPDDLAAEVRDELGDSNISGICQAALRAELATRKATAEAIAEGGFDRVEVYDSKKDRDVAFQGRIIGEASWLEQTAYLTPKGTIAVYSQKHEELWTYADFEEFAENEEPGSELLPQVADALGQSYTEELDI